MRSATGCSTPKIRTSCSVDESSVMLVAKSRFAAAVSSRSATERRPQRLQHDADRERGHRRRDRRDRVHEERGHEEGAEAERRDRRLGDRADRRSTGPRVAREKLLEAAVALRGLERPAGREVEAQQRRARRLDDGEGRPRRLHHGERLEADPHDDQHGCDGEQFADRHGQLAERPCVHGHGVAGRRPARTRCERSPPASLPPRSRRGSPRPTSAPAARAATSRTER